MIVQDDSACVLLIGSQHGLVIGLKKNAFIQTGEGGIPTHPDMNKEVQASTCNLAYGKRS